VDQVKALLKPLQRRDQIVWWVIDQRNVGAPHGFISTAIHRKGEEGREY
jgi:hypothetical protein